LPKKEEWAREKRGLSQQAREEGVWVRQNPIGPPATKPKLPSGQHLVQGFPVLDLGKHPEISLENWQLTIKGLVKHPVAWTWRDFEALPKMEDTSDFHCVTTWSTFENRWEGVSFRHLMETVQPLPEAAFVYFTCYDGYSTNLPLSICDDEDVMLAYQWNGQPLTREHGGPVRMLVPKKYGWKSAKWIKEIEFLNRDRLGFWEVRGYSNTADPWTEDRYS